VVEDFREKYLSHRGNVRHSPVVHPDCYALRSRRFRKRGFRRYFTIQEKEQKQTQEQKRKNFEGSARQT
jgi:hypothetical protein